LRNLLVARSTWRSSTVDSGYSELSELNQRLVSLEAVRFRMALVRDGDTWKAHTLIVDHLPEQGSREVTAFDMNYGSVHFVAGLIGGRTAVTWLHQRAGEVRPPGTNGPVRRFTLPSFSGKVSWRRLPSHASYDFNRMPWPITRYDATGVTAYTPPQHDGFLLADGLPFYPNLQTAILRLVYEVTDVEQFQNSSVSPAVIVRIADTAAWLGQIKLSPTAITMTVSGTRVAGAQVTISGSSDVQFQHHMPAPGPVECPLPNGVPSPLWIVLSRDNQWLDYYHRDERWPIANQPQANVTIEAGDPAIEIAALIAQGEGMTTEFKSEVPNNRDQMLKTIAAFANGAGGVMLLGVKDKTGELVGVSGNPDDITQMIRNTVFPDPVPHIDEVEVEGRRILAVYVRKGASPPYGLHATNTHYYVRRGATTFPARPEELHAIVLASQPRIPGPFAPYVQ